MQAAPHRCALSQASTMLTPKPSVTRDLCLPAGKPLWVSLSLDDSLRGCLRSGESLQQALAALAGTPHLQAVLLNCCAPAAITHAMPLLRQAAPEGEPHELTTTCFAELLAADELPCYQ
jgi:hypothetical protein